MRYGYKPLNLTEGQEIYILAGDDYNPKINKLPYGGYTISLITVKINDNFYNLDSSYVKLN